MCSSYHCTPLPQPTLLYFPLSLLVQTQQHVFVSPFFRLLKDPFPPSRTAGLNGLAVTSSYYTPQDVANKILPGLCPTMVDPEKTVREKVLYVELSACS